MYNNIGGKLKTFAILIATLGIIASIIGGIMIWLSGDGFFASGYSYSYNYFSTSKSGDGFCFLSGLLVVVAGSLFSYIGSWMLYAFGSLVENTQIIADKLTSESRFLPSSAAPSAPAAKSFWTCSECKTCNSLNTLFCSKCGHSKP